LRNRRCYPGRPFQSNFVELLPVLDHPTNPFDADATFDA
jgi:hypothetical protein